jgi:hypothetical protein
VTTFLSRIDHLVIAAPDLPAAIQSLGALLGVTPSMGGQHPAWGTRNALISLGPRVYLEIMGPDPALALPARKRPFAMDSLSAPRLVTWACRGEDLGAIAAIAFRLGVDLGDVQHGSRSRQDGTLLTWTLTDLLADREGGVVPFFIDWGGSPHPAESAPAGCALLELRAAHPEPGRITRAFDGLGIDLPVAFGAEPSLAARIKTPLGEVEIGRFS